MLNERLYGALSDLYWGAYGVSRWLVERGPGAALRLLVHEEAPAIARFRMPLRRRLWLWRHGFLSQADVLYGEDGITKDNYHRYLSSYQRDLTQRINGRWGEALENKLLFHHLLDGFPERRSTVHAHLMDGRYTPVDSEGTATSGADAADRVVALLDEHHRLVLKPTYGTIGKRILMCEATEEGYRVNGEHHSEEEFAALIPDLDDYLVSEFVEQAPYASALYPDSPNTLRVLTMVDPDTGEPFVAAAAHRIGTERSAPLDNWSRGGLSADVNASGDLGSAVQYPYDGHRERHTDHPDTGAPIAGVAIPGWPAIREGILDIAAGCSQIPYVGWDLVVTSEGEFTVIEGNNCSGVRVFQVHEPLLDDPRVRRFYEHYGAL
ncbi:sugar-transfer associated ATP-grasp domain-containing protein [Halococcus sp. AFM35]|uniref:sugar-transfer associated ATP-grasp domain-containing protein n=1 Tax=Halococcus sp. AFM35 TaxID=3421653 RepID=UPI003EBA7A9E